MADGDLSSEGSHRLSAGPHGVCRRLSSSSESGFNSDISDEHNVSPSSVTDEALQQLNGFVADSVALDENSVLFPHRLSTVCKTFA